VQAKGHVYGLLETAGNTAADEAAKDADDISSTKWLYGHQGF